MQNKKNRLDILSAKTKNKAKVIVYDWCPQRCKECQQCVRYICSPYYGYN